MMNRRQQRTEAAQLAADRRRREDEAPRLQDEVPSLASLSLALDERRPGNAPGGGHIRRVVVERAPALFVVPCTAVGCTGGVHTLTAAVMRALHERATRFDGDTSCDGCTCVLHHAGSAEYR